ncbi:hypothetical protein, partial [Kitasatospora sp. NPDC093558]|uniref:hypothetical protein n=1 Tax=Kitasatospora sp. NPDC093558 TaxID=3155201 RepID=UPI0034212170
GDQRQLRYLRRTFPGLVVYENEDAGPRCEFGPGGHAYGTAGRAGRRGSDGYFTKLSTTFGGQTPTLSAPIE